MKKFVLDYLTFTKKERIAIILLIACMIFIFFWPAVYSSAIPPKSIHTDTTWISKMKELELKSDSTEPSDYTENNEQSSLPYDPGISASHSTLFNFDPNKITEDQWHQLGISQKTTTTILKYLGKGGSFKKPEDLKKIYGMKPVDYERLLPYIQIASIKDGPPPDFSSAPDKNTLCPPMDLQDGRLLILIKVILPLSYDCPGLAANLPHVL